MSRLDFLHRFHGELFVHSVPCVIAGHAEMKRDLVARGYVEYRYACGHGVYYTRRDLCEIRDGEIVLCLACQDARNRNGGNN